MSTHNLCFGQKGCGYSLEPPHTKAVLMGTHNLCFEQKYEKYHSFLSENFKFLEEKFSIYMYLNRCVFVMASLRRFKQIYKTYVS